MAKFPEPPGLEALISLGPAVRILPEGFMLWHIYFRGGSHPADWSSFRTFGPVAEARFDHHRLPTGDQARGILYAATEGPTCLAEVFQRSRTIDRTSGRPWLVGFVLAAPVPLLDLTGVWPTAAGASMALSSGQRSRARRWSQAIYTAYPEIRGLWYPSSMAQNAPAVALYERALTAMPQQPIFNRPLDDPALRGMIGLVARSLGYVLV